MIWILAIALLFLVVGAYLGLVIRSAKREVGVAPRTPMTTCDKHGVFPSKYTYHLEGATKEPIEMCPFCMEDRFGEAAMHKQRGVRNASGR